MDSFEIYKIAVNQYHKAMDYHSNIDFEKKKKGQKLENTKSYKERRKQKIEYDKALFYFKLYKSFAKIEEREYRR